MALRAVTRERSRDSDRTRSDGSASSAWYWPSRIACASLWASCMYSGEAAAESGLNWKGSLVLIGRLFFSTGFGESAADQPQRAVGRVALRRHATGPNVA